METLFLGTSGLKEIRRTPSKAWHENGYVCVAANPSGRPQLYPGKVSGWLMCERVCNTVVSQTPWEST